MPEEGGAAELRDSSSIFQDTRSLSTKVGCGNFQDGHRDCLPEVLTGLGEEGLQVDMGVLLLEERQLLESLLGELLLPDLLEDVHQGLVVRLREPDPRLK